MSFTRCLFSRRGACRVLAGCLWGTDGVLYAALANAACRRAKKQPKTNKQPGAVQGVFLGANGWHPDYDRALGAPLAPATNATGSNSERLLVRNFDSGTNVTWDLDKGTGIIYWYGTVRSIEKHGKNRAGRPPKHRANHTLCPTATRAGFKGGWYLVPVTYYPVLGVG